VVETDLKFNQTFKPLRTFSGRENYHAGEMRCCAGAHSPRDFRFIPAESFQHESPIFRRYECGQGAVGISWQPGAFGRAVTPQRANVVELLAQNRRVLIIIAQEPPQKSNDELSAKGRRAFGTMEFVLQSLNTSVDFIRFIRR